MKLAFIAASQPTAQEALTQCTARYGQCEVDVADYIIALGGDGLLLETLHKAVQANKPVFGMRRGSVGFLLNDYKIDDLPKQLEHAKSVILHPLQMTAKAIDGSTQTARAFNEISLLRETRQTAKLNVSIDGVERLPELICDGIMVATPAGSTGYNLSAHGPILPLTSDVLALTPISAFRPRRWRGAILPKSAQITIEVREPEKRPVSAVADFTEIRDVRKVEVQQQHKTFVTLLFDPEAPLEERILREQFTE